MALSNSALNFAAEFVGATSKAQSVTLTNAGGGALSIGSISLTGANPGDFVETNNCGRSLAAGAQCGISVTFRPAGAGSRSAAIIVTTSATGSPFPLR